MTGREIKAACLAVDFTPASNDPGPGAYRPGDYLTIATRPGLWKVESCRAWSVDVGTFYLLKVINRAGDRLTVTGRQVRGVRRIAAATGGI